MNINGVTAYDYTQAGNDLALVLGCTVDEALAMNTAIIEVRTDAGDLVETYAGYTKRSATIDAITGRVTLSLFAAGDGTAAAVDALAKQAADMQAKLDKQAAAIEELSIIATGGGVSKG